MEQSIKAVSQLCKLYCDKKAPSKKEIAAVLSCLEQEGELSSPKDILDYRKWDSLTTALAQHVMNARKAAELKTWGLILKALKAAREEGKFIEDARMLLGFSPDRGRVGQPGEGDSVSRYPEDRQPQPAVAPAVPATPPPNKDKPQDGDSELTAPLPDREKDAPPPYPATPRRSLYPLLSEACAENPASEGGELCGDVAPVGEEWDHGTAQRGGGFQCDTALGGGEGSQDTAQRGGVGHCDTAPKGGECNRGAAQRGGVCCGETAPGGGGCGSAAPKGGECNRGAAQRGGVCCGETAPGGGGCGSGTAQKNGECWCETPRGGCSRNIDWGGGGRRVVNLDSGGDRCVVDSNGDGFERTPDPSGGGGSRGTSDLSDGGGSRGGVSGDRKRMYSAIQGNGGSSGVGPALNADDYKHCQVTDWMKIRELAEDKGLSGTLEAYPVVAMGRGPVWIPLDPKGVARLIEAVEKKGLRSPLTLNALEALTAAGPMLPYDIENLMRMILKSVQYTLWKEEWMIELKRIMGIAERDPFHPLHGSSVQRLSGSAEGMNNPHAQVIMLIPPELLATTDAALKAFRRFARTAEPPTPWSDITQGPAESFQEFADRLIKAVEGSELPKAVHAPVIVDCLKQKAHEDIKTLLRAAPGKITTPGEIIKYVLDKQKTTPLSNEGIAVAVQDGFMNAMATMSVLPQAARVAKGPCFRCGQFGHLKAQCKLLDEEEKDNDRGVVCQLCGKSGHPALQCKSFKIQRQGNSRGRVPRAQGPSHGTPNVALTLDCRDRPLVKAYISYVDLPPNFPGRCCVSIIALIDSGADVTVISEKDWPAEWPVGSSQIIRGVGGTIPTGRSLGEVEIVIVNRDGSLERPASLVPLIAKVPGTLLGRDFLKSVGARITNL
ncbi:uncharacterized protein [Excalfactoria chinensis]|uniref:uncharacterized protein n=1 Tax=Excalfactoria chinensis TaxID=46218 RepID=UPI003B3B157D